MQRVNDELTRLATSSPADLRSNWLATFGDPAPDLPSSLLGRALAHHVQEGAFGGPSARVRRVLDQLCGDELQPAEPTIKLKPGSRLLREWNGRLHTVQVIDDGLLFEDRHFHSLSQIAREITGAHWSGPRFFGLKKPVHPPRREVAGD